MKVILIDLNKVNKVKDIEPSISQVVKESPDVVLFLGYKREFQEEVLHPIQKMMKNSQSEANGTSLVIWKHGIKDFSFIQKNLPIKKAPVLIIEI